MRNDRIEFLHNVILQRYLKLQFLSCNHTFRWVFRLNFSCLLSKGQRDFHLPWLRWEEVATARSYFSPCYPLLHSSLCLDRFESSLKFLLFSGVFTTMSCRALRAKENFFASLKMQARMRMMRRRFRKIFHSWTINLDNDQPCWRCKRSFSHSHDLETSGGGGGRKKPERTKDRKRD